MIEQWKSKQLHPGKNNTRFCPTPTGVLHIGHVYMSLVNIEMANIVGGQFILRLEDLFANKVRADRMINRKVGVRIIEDLRWMGCDPDLISWQSDTYDFEKDFLSIYDHLNIPDEPIHLSQRSVLEDDRSKYTTPLHETPHRVVADHFLSCNPIIRGDKLRQEHYFYQYLCNVMGFPIPSMIYLPRLNMVRHHDISKSVRTTLNIPHLRNEGWSADEIIDVLRKRCLKDPDGDFKIDNIQSDPTIDPTDFADG